MSRPRAFTLIELLVVVAIIVALLAILLPSLNRSIAVAQQAVCRSNLHQLFLSNASYIADSMGKTFPYYWNPQAGQNKIWIRRLQPYISSQHDVLICPTTDNPPGKDGFGNDAGSPNTRMGSALVAWADARHGEIEPWDRSSYGYNTWLSLDNRYIPDRDVYASLKDIATPSRVPMAGDACWRDLVHGSLKVFPTDPGSPFFSSPSNADRAAWWATNRHGRTTNIAVMDGSVTAIPLRELWSLRWHKSYDTTAPVSGVPAGY